MTRKHYDHMSEQTWYMFERWHTFIAPLIADQDDSHFPSRLMHALSQVIAVDEPILLIVFMKGRTPSIFFEYQPDATLKKKYDEYLDNLFLLDPVYRVFKEQAYTGFYDFADLAPEGFFESEVYRRYYRCNYHYEIGYIFDLGKEGFATLCAAKSLGFHECEKKFYIAIESLVVSLFKAHILQRSYNHNKVVDTRQEKMEKILNNFGRSILSEKEHEILQLMFRGHSMKSMAHLLSRSIDTIKKHHRAIYDKLNISSQRELFPLLINVLEYKEGSVDRNTLDLHLSDHKIKH